MGIRKYEDVKGYWVYSIKIPSINKYYIGISKQKCCFRWHKSGYLKTVLKDYFDEWEDMEKTVLVDGLSKEDALKYEDNIIQALSMNNLCINKYRSGLITSDMNTYNKQLLKTNTEYRERTMEYQRQYRKDNREQINQRAKQYYENNKQKINNKVKQRRLKKRLEKQQQTSLQ